MKKTLEDWLFWQESLHLSEIDLGLDRIGKVAAKLNLLSPVFPIITVAGTNGKGSTVAFLDSILLAEGYKTGAYTSPHLVNYNERIVLNGKQASDDLIIHAFEAIDKARRDIKNNKDELEDISLTYFEFSTLAAMFIYKQQNVDVAILEVGLGGRLDAANLWDTSLAIITSIGVDHIDWLGDNREIIAVEKSGIMRKNIPVISGDNNPPTTIASEAGRIGAKLKQINRDFSYSLKKSNFNQEPLTNIKSSFSRELLSTKNKNTWHLQISDGYREFSLPKMQGDFQINNAATAITGLHSIKSVLPVSDKSINKGLQTAQVQGRLQVLQKNPEWLIDVAHNPHAAKELVNYMKQNPVTGKTFAIFSMLRDKDISEVIQIMDDVIDEWHIVATQGSRGLSLVELKEHFNKIPKTLQSKQTNKQAIEQSAPLDTLRNIKSYNSFNEACEALKNMSKDKDRVVAFGSFLVISEILVN